MDSQTWHLITPLVCLFLSIISNSIPIQCTLVTILYYLFCRFGSYLVVLYIITKMLYFTNVVAQLLLLNKVLAVDYGLFGIEIIQWMMSGTD